MSGRDNPTNGQCARKLEIKDLAQPKKGSLHLMKMFNLSRKKSNPNKVPN